MVMSNPMESAPPQFLRELLTTQYLTLAGYIVLTYDYLLTLHLEIEYIWLAPWNAVKVVFLLNRYCTLIGQLYLMLGELGLLSHGSRKFCTDLQWFLATFVLFSSETTRILLLLRAWALWKCSLRVAASLVSVYVLYIIAITGYGFYILLKYGTSFVFLYLQDTKVCVVYSNKGNAWVLGFVPLLLDTFVFGMIAYHLYKFNKGSQQLQHSPLLRLLVRDAFLFYMMNVTHDVLIMLSVTVFHNHPQLFVYAAVSFPLLNVAGQRVFLNLRGIQSQRYAIQYVNCDVDRQIVAMRHRSFWQTVDVWMNVPHHELALSEQPSRSGTRRTTEGEGSSYELEFIPAHMDASEYSSRTHGVPCSI